MKWTETTLGDIADIKGRIGWRGYTVEDLRDSGPLALGATQITADNQIDLSKPTYISQEKYDESPEIKLETGDILVVKVGNTIGKVAIIRRDIGPATLNPNAVALKRVKVNRLYLYYYLTADYAQHFLKSRSLAAAQPAINQTTLKEMPVRLPEPKVQDRIAGILSAYDELMENSQRRIRILEAMARALYREWFVHFRIPAEVLTKAGAPPIKLVASPLGLIPQGWEVKNLATVADVNRAQINARTAPQELHYIDISSVSPGQIDSITNYAFADAPGRARRIVQHGDVLWSCVRPNRRSHAQVMHPEPDTIASTGFAVLTATKVPFTFLYFATTTDDFVAFLTNNATGAAYPAVSGATFEKAELLIPPARLLKEFGDATIPIAEQIHTLQRQTHNLRRTRDLLLPRLLSGQVKATTN